MGHQLTRDQISAICREVFKRYPLVEGVKPTVKRQDIRGQERYLLIFRVKEKASDGASIPISVRAVADHKGKIVKMTTSR